MPSQGMYHAMWRPPLMPHRQPITPSKPPYHRNRLSRRTEEELLASAAVLFHDWHLVLNFGHSFLYQQLPFLTTFIKPVAGEADSSPLTNSVVFYMFKHLAV